MQDLIPGEEVPKSRYPKLAKILEEYSKDLEDKLTKFILPSTRASSNWQDYRPINGE